MSYKDFTISSVRNAFGILRLLPETEDYNSFCREFETNSVYQYTDSFIKELEFSIEMYREIDSHSESWLRENFISLFLREVWKNHRKLYIWQGFSLNVDVDQGLTGEPDYYVTKKSSSPNVPYCIIGEAKRENFEQGWGQCLAGMKAAEMLNEKSDIEIPVYGIVSSGVYLSLIHI